MAGDDAEQWMVLIEQVRSAPSPVESPALAQLYALAMRAGTSVLRRRFRGLSDEDCKDVVNTKFLPELTAIVQASNSWGFFVTAIVRAVIDDRRRAQTGNKHQPELTRAAGAREQSQSEDSRADTLDMAACLASFSSRDQQILRAVVEGEDRERIAALFGTSRANVDQVLSRARKRWEQWR